MKKIIIILAAFCAIVGCSTDDAPNFYFDIVAVDSVLDIPESFTVNQKDTLQVVYLRPSNCHIFNGFNFVINENERDITVIARVIDNDNGCANLENDLSMAPLVFNPSQEGEVILNFFNGNDADGNSTFLTFNVPILE